MFSQLLSHYTSALVEPWPWCSEVMWTAQNHLQYKHNSLFLSKINQQRSQYNKKFISKSCGIFLFSNIECHIQTDGEPCWIPLSRKTELSKCMETKARFNLLQLVQVEL